MLCYRNLNRFLDIGLLRGDTKEAATTEGMAYLAVSEDSRESSDEAASDDAAAMPTAEALDANWVPEQDYLAFVCERYSLAGCRLKAGGTVAECSSNFWLSCNAALVVLQWWLADTMLPTIYQCKVCQCLLLTSHASPAVLTK